MPDYDAARRAATLLREKRVEQQRQAILSAGPPEPEVIPPPDIPAPEPVALEPAPALSGEPKPDSLETSLGADPLTETEELFNQKEIRKKQIRLRATQHTPSAPKMSGAGIAAEKMLWDPLGRPIARALDQVGLNPSRHDFGGPAPVVLDEQSEDIMKRLVAPEIPGYGTPDEVLKTITEDADRYGPNAHIAKRAEARQVLSNYIARVFGEEVSPEDAFLKYRGVAKRFIKEKKMGDKEAELFHTTMPAGSSSKNYHVLHKGKLIGSFARPDELTDEEKKLARSTAQKNSTNMYSVAATTMPASWNQSLNTIHANKDKLAGERGYETIFVPAFPKRLQERMIDPNDQWIPTEVMSDGTLAVNSNVIREGFKLAKMTELIRDIPELGGNASVSRAKEVLGADGFREKIVAPANDYAQRELKRMTQYNVATPFHLNDPYLMAEQIAAGEDPGFLEAFFNLPGGILSPSKYAKAAIRYGGALPYIASYTRGDGKKGTPGIPLPSFAFKPLLNSSNVLRALAQGDHLKAFEEASVAKEWSEGNLMPMIWLDEDFIDRSRAPFAAAMWGPHSGFEKSDYMHYGTRIESQDKTYLDWITGMMAPVGNAYLSYILSPDPIKFGGKDHAFKSYDYNFIADYKAVGHAISSALGADLLEDYSLLSKEKRAGLDAIIGTPATFFGIFLEPDVFSAAAGAGRLAKGVAAGGKMGKAARAFKTAKIDPHLDKLVPTWKAKLSNTIDDLSAAEAKISEATPEEAADILYKEMEKAGPRGQAARLIVSMEYNTGREMVGETSGSFLNGYKDLVKSATELEEQIKKIDSEILASDNQAIPQQGDYVAHIVGGEFVNNSPLKVKRVDPDSGEIIVEKKTKIKKTKETYLSEERIPIDDVKLIKGGEEEAETWAELQAQMLQNKIQRERINELAAIQIIQTGVDQRAGMKYALDATNSHIAMTKGGGAPKRGKKTDVEYVVFKNKPEIERLDKELDVLYKQANAIRDEYGRSDAAALYVRTSEAIEAIRLKLGRKPKEFYYGKGDTLPFGDIMPFYAQNHKRIGRSAKAKKGSRYFVGALLEEGPEAVEKALAENLRLLNLLKRKTAKSEVIPRPELVFPDRLSKLASEVVSGKYSGSEYLNEVASGQTARSKAVRGTNFNKISFFDTEDPFPFLKNSAGENIKVDGFSQRLTADEFLSLFLREWGAAGGDVTEGLITLAKNFPEKHFAKLDGAIDNYFSWLEGAIPNKANRLDVLRDMIPTKGGDRYNSRAVLAALKEVKQPRKHRPVLDHLGEIDIEYARGVADEAWKNHKLVKKELTEIGRKVKAKTKERDAARQKVGDSREELKKILDERNSLVEELNILYKALSGEASATQWDLYNSKHPKRKQRVRPTTQVEIYNEIKRVEKALKKNSVIARNQAKDLSFSDALNTARVSREHRIVLEESLKDAYANIPTEMKNRLVKTQNDYESKYQKLLDNKAKLAEATGAQERLIEAVRTVRNSMAAMQKRVNDNYIETGKRDYDLQVEDQPSILAGATAGTTKAAMKAGKIEFVPATYKQRLVARYGEEAVDDALLNRGVMIEGGAKAPITRQGVNRPTTTLIELGRKNPTADTVKFDSLARDQIEDLEIDLAKQAELKQRYESPEIYADEFRRIVNAPTPYGLGFPGVQFKHRRANFFEASKAALYQTSVSISHTFDPLLGRVGTKARKEVQEVVRRMYNYQQTVFGHLNVIAQPKNGGAANVWRWLSTHEPVSIETGAVRSRVAKTPDISHFNTGTETPVELWVQRVLGEQFTSNIEDTLGMDKVQRFEELFSKLRRSISFDESGKPVVNKPAGLTTAEEAEWLALRKEVNDFYGPKGGWGQSGVVSKLSPKELKKAEKNLGKLVKEELGKIDTLAADSRHSSLSLDAIATMWLASGQQAGEVIGILRKSVQRLAREVAEKAREQGRTVNANDMKYIEDKMKNITYALLRETDNHQKAQAFFIRGVIHGALEEKLIRDMSRAIGPSFPDSIAADMNKMLNGFQAGDTIDFRKAIAGWSQWGMAAGYIDPKTGGLVKEFKTIEQSLFGMAASVNQLVKIASEGDINKMSRFPTSMLNTFEEASGVVAKELAQVYLKSDPLITRWVHGFTNLMRVWKMAAVIGLLSPRGNHFMNMGFGDFAQTWWSRGVVEASGVMIGNAPMYVPILGKGFQNFLSKTLLEAKDAGKIPEGFTSMLGSVFSPLLRDVFTGSDRMFKTGDGLRSGKDLLGELQKVGATTHIVSQEMLETEGFVRKWMKNNFWKFVKPGGTEHWLYKNWAKHWGNWIGDIQTRQRANAYLHARTKLNMSIDDAKKYMDDQYYDWSTGIARWEAMTLGRFLAFHTFWRLSFGQLIRAIAEPFTDRPASVLYKGLRGKTRLARVVQQKRLFYDGIPAWLTDRETPDEDEISIFEASLAAGRKKPGWAADRPIWYRKELSFEEQRAHFEKTGRYATHTVVLQPLHTGPDVLHMGTVIGTGFMGVAANLSGTDTVSMNPKQQKKLWDTGTDQLYPFFADRVKGQNYFLGNRALIPVNRDMDPWIRMGGPIPGVFGEVVEIEGEYFHYAGETGVGGFSRTDILKGVGYAYPVVSTDIPRLYKDLYLNNPNATRDTPIEGLITAFKNSVGLKEYAYDQHADMDREKKSMARDAKLRLKIAEEKAKQK